MKAQKQQIKTAISPIIMPQQPRTPIHYIHVSENISIQLGPHEKRQETKLNTLGLILQTFELLGQSLFYQLQIATNKNK